MAKPEPMVVLVLPLAEAEELAEVLLCTPDAAGLEPVNHTARTLQARARRRLDAAIQAAARVTAHFSKGGE